MKMDVLISVAVGRSFCDAETVAVAARFGIGGDFWLNLLLTICGYIPGTMLIILL